MPRLLGAEGRRTGMACINGGLAPTMIHAREMRALPEDRRKTNDGANRLMT